MLKNLRRTFGDIDSDDVLERLGLERRHSPAEKVMPALAIFGAGVLVGVGIGMILAPKTGSELRDDLRTRIKGVTDREMRAGNGEEIARPSPAPVRPG